MERHALSLKINDGKMNDYRRKLGDLWPRITGLLDRTGIRNFSIWNARSLVFIYFECEDGMQISGKDSDDMQNIMKEMDEADLYTWISAPGENMRLMYHNFGIVRESKELIRHRVFMTRLKPGCEEEYKARHDALIRQRGNAVDPGPDSNFSIWSAGGYIFGYDEIDTSMETEETPESRRETIAWETRQLEIMDWITNDVDWMTGEHHPASIRIAWHQGK